MPLRTEAERCESEDVARGTGSRCIACTGLWVGSWRVRAENVSREAVGSKGGVEAPA